MLRIKRDTLVVFECSKMKTIGKPCEGELHARFEVAGDGNVDNAPSLDPTRTRPDSGKCIAEQQGCPS